MARKLFCEINPTCYKISMYKEILRRDLIDIFSSVKIAKTKSNKELNNIVKMFSPDNALAIAMDPNTGEILGMSSRPSYDPNNYKNYSAETLNRNLPIWMTYEPGSTFKIITTSAAVEEGVIDLEHDTFYDPGSVKVSGAKIRCWKSGGHGHQSFLQVFENSCNPGFVSMGFRLGKEKLFSYIDLFGFGEKTGIDLNGEGKGILFNLDKVHDLELATTAFGQGVSVTPIQQVTAVSSIVNGGYLYKPYVVKSILDTKTNNIIKTNEKDLVRKTISLNTSKIMRMALESVVSNGGGKMTYIDGYRVGGKTGTAQKVGSDGRYMSGNYILSFIGFMPANDPEFVIYIALDHPKGVTQYGGVVSAPIARNVLKDIISIYDLKEDVSGLPKVYRWDDIKYVMIPDVIGKTKKDARKLLNGFSIEFVGDGDKVIDTSPSVNSRTKEGSTIKVLLN